MAKSIHNEGPAAGAAQFRAKGSQNTHHHILEPGGPVSTQPGENGQKDNCNGGDDLWKCLPRVGYHACYGFTQPYAVEGDRYGHGEEEHDTDSTPEFHTKGA